MDHLDPVRSFVDGYKFRRDYYDKLAAIVADHCRRYLYGAGVKAIVTHRSKERVSLEAKLRRREREIGRPFRDEAEIESHLFDLAGVRIALYFPRFSRTVDRFLRDEFHVAAVRLHAPDGQPLMEEVPPLPVPEMVTTAGYRAAHYRLHLLPGSVDRSMRRFLAGWVEVQVASVIMHAWSEVEHDLRYKPMTGNLSDEEKAILAELNRLTLAGETQLQALHGATESRLSGQDRPMHDHFELAELIDGILAEDALASKQLLDYGRLDRLFEVLQATAQASPAAFGALVRRAVPFDPEHPVADQLMDAVFREQPELYRTYMRITDPDDPSGVFLKAWSELERLMRHARIGKLPAVTLSETEREDLRYLRRVRNLLINERHSVNRDQLVGLTFAVHRLQERLRQQTGTGDSGHRLPVS